MVVTFKNGNGRKNGNGNGNRRLRPSNLSIDTAPANSFDRIQRLAVRRQQYATEHQKASDDTRLHQLQTSSQQFIGEEQQGEANRPRFFKYATIKGNNLKFPIYTVQAVLEDRLMLSSIGTPHNEMVVVNKNATFNGISMTEFRPKDIIHPGDHVLVESSCYWFDGKRYLWRALAISFPRYSTVSLEKGNNTWITHGTVSVMKSDIIDLWLIDTELLPLNGSPGDNTVMIRAPKNAFLHVDMKDDSFVVDSTVIVRASLVGEGEPYSKVATGNDTPWMAELVTLAGGGVRQGNGFLQHGYKGSMVIIGNRFGYIHVPKELITSELEKAPNYTAVRFEACLNRIPDNQEKVEKNMKLYKWRAVFVEIQKLKPQSTGRSESPRKDDAPHGEGAPGAETVEVSVATTGDGVPGAADTTEVSSSDSDEDLICDEAILLLLQLQTARDLAANILPVPPPIGAQLEEQIAKNLEEMCSSSQPDAPVQRTAANWGSTATVPSSISSRPEVPRTANLESTVNVPGAIPAASITSQPTAKLLCPICGPIICFCKNKSLKAALL